MTGDNTSAVRGTESDRAHSGGCRHAGKKIEPYRAKQSLEEHLIKVRGYEKKAAQLSAGCGWVEALSIDVQERSITRKAG